jgi:hypothetical protein
MSVVFGPSFDPMGRGAFDIRWFLARTSAVTSAEPFQQHAGNYT